MYQSLVSFLQMYVDWKHVHPALLMNLSAKCISTKKNTSVQFNF